MKQITPTAATLLLAHGYAVTLSTGEMLQYDRPVSARQAYKCLAHWARVCGADGYSAE